MDSPGVEYFIWRVHKWACRRCALAGWADHCRTDSTRSNFPIFNHHNCKAHSAPFMTSLQYIYCLSLQFSMRLSGFALFRSYIVKKTLQLSTVTWFSQTRLFVILHLVSEWMYGGLRAKTLNELLFDLFLLCVCVCCPWACCVCVYSATRRTQLHQHQICKHLFQLV